MDEQKEKKQGDKGKGQKFKSLLVWDTLQKRTDESHGRQTLTVAVAAPEPLKQEGKGLTFDPKCRGRCPHRPAMQNKARKHILLYKRVVMCFLFCVYVVFY